MNKKILSMMVTFSLLFSTMVVQAEEQVVTSPGVANILITANITSAFEVTIPNEVTINEKIEQAFEITTKGEISSSEILNINIPEKVTMSTTGKDDIDLPITSSATEITSAQLAASDEVIINCYVDATTLTAGNWSGDCEIEVQLISTNTVSDGDAN